MKKKLFFPLVVIFLFASIPFYGNASGEVVTLGSAQVNSTGTTGEAVISGTFNSAVKSILTGLTNSDTLQVRYGMYSDSSTPPTEGSLTPISCGGSSPDCPLTYTSDGGTFTATIAGLAPVVAASRQGSMGAAARKRAALFVGILGQRKGTNRGHR